MGFDIELFVESVDEELICSICTDVLENPLQLPCEHFFCGSCLRSWFEAAPVKTCPIDGVEVNVTKVIGIPRCVKNMLSRLSVQCHHCNYVMSLAKYKSHNCFQQILSEMGGYIDEIDRVLAKLNRTKH